MDPENIKLWVIAGSCVAAYIGLVLFFTRDKKDDDHPPPLRMVIPPCGNTTPHKCTCEKGADRHDRANKLGKIVKDEEGADDIPNHKEMDTKVPLA